MAFLDFLKKQNTPQVERPTHFQRPEINVPRNVENLPDNVKAQAVDAARPAAELMEKATTPRSDPPKPQPTPVSPAKGRSLGMER